jgi:branched-chain amino acid aminotransferase
MTEEHEWIAYVNGEYVAQAEARLSIFDHVVLYGDGVYDTMCAWNGYIFKMKEHIDRLFRSIHVFQISMPLGRGELEDVILKVVETNSEKNQYIKVLVTRGVGPKPLLTPVGCKTSVVVFSRPYMWLAERGEGEKAEKARITNIRRIPAQCLDPKAKNINYANFVLAKMEALNSGADEAIMLDVHGFVNEAPGYNIFVVKEDKLHTPPAENILVGVTRETVFEIAQTEKMPIIEERMIPYDLYNADEVFLSSTAGGIIPIVEIDGRRISSGKPGRITHMFKNLYFEMLEKGIHGTPFASKQS